MPACPWASSIDCLQRRQPRRYARVGTYVRGRPRRVPSHDHRPRHGSHAPRERLAHRARRDSGSRTGRAAFDARRSQGTARRRHDGAADPAFQTCGRADRSGQCADEGTGAFQAGIDRRPVGPPETRAN